VVRLEQEHPDNVFLMMGLHPTYVRIILKYHVEEELAKENFMP
jgi:TatD DNase family protein